MSRRRRKNDTEVTLLPFLAVLVCTMGALIVLLVVVMQQAQVEGSSTPPTQLAQTDVEESPSMVSAESGLFDLPEPTIDTPALDPKTSQTLVVDQSASIDQSASSKPPPAQPPTLEPVEPPIAGPSATDVASAQMERDNYLWEIKTLSESQQQYQQQLSGKALQLSSLHEETQRLVAELKQLQQTVDDASASLAASPTPTTDGEALAEIENEIALKHSELAALVAAAENQKPRYELVPYNGSRGTTRRPIYVECRENEVVLQPEGITLTIDDLQLADEEANPLAASLRAIREYWKRTDTDASRGEPYPLLVVRPGGERLYLACRGAMKAWDSEFGYELVENDIELAYPDPDSTLASILTDTCMLARQQQAQMLRMIAAMRPSDAPTYRAARGGGFVFDGKPGQTNASQANQQLPNFEVPEFTADRSQDAGNFGSSESRQDSLTNRGRLSQTGEQTQSQQGPSGHASQTGNSVSLAKHRGQNWALPNAVQGAIPAERPLFIALNSAQLVLEAEPGTRQVPAVVTFQNGRSAAVQSLVTSIWERIKTWGVAGPGVYWRPKLRFDVAPDAETAYEELAMLLEGSGLEVQRH